MTVVILIVYALVMVILTTDLLLIVFWWLNFKVYQNKLNEWPFVSIFLAARNEAENIEDCLLSLTQLDYPEDRIEILVGDDQSIDDTYQIAEKLAKQFPQIRVLQIKEKLGSAKGKANVLANLAKKAKGDFFFFTDADIRLPITWIKHMLMALTENVGIVSGVTAVSGDAIFAKWQNIEWLNALGMLKVVTDLNLAVTGVGNNMLVTRKAYEDVGGYESIPFSIVEDFQLTKYVVKAGYKVVNIVDDKVKAMTKPVAGIRSFLHQRKRWMHGALAVPFILKLILIFQAMTIPLLLLLFILKFHLALIFLSVKLILRWIFIVEIHKKIKLNVNFNALISYEIYAGIFTLITMVYFILPAEIDWKGRKY